MSGVNEFEPPLDPVYAQIHPIDPAMDAGELFFDRRHSNFQIMNIVDDPVELGVDTLETLVHPAK